MKNSNKSKLFSLLTLFLLLTLSVSGRVPPKPKPARMVNDYASLLLPSQVRELEERLLHFSRESSNQIVVITLKELDNDIAAVATEIGEKWGVGGSKFNNGVVILIKPKWGIEDGQAFIATGYGLEGALPDALCRRIVEREMIPHFKKNDYKEGIDAALKVIMEIAQGEYSFKEYIGEPEGSPIAAILVLLAVVIFVVAITRKGPPSSGGKGGGFRSPVPFIFGAPSRGGFRVGGPSGGGSFGGGRFGGGGAGGRW